MWIRYIPADIELEAIMRTNKEGDLVLFVEGYELKPLRTEHIELIDATGEDKCALQQAGYIFFENNGKTR